MTSTFNLCSHTVQKQKQRKRKKQKSADGNKKIIIKEEPKEEPKDEPKDEPEEITLISTMAAILMTPGPVCSFQGLCRGKWSMRHLKRHQYDEAVVELQRLQLGKQVKTHHGAKVFIKKSPSEAEDFLMHTNLGTLEWYETRYKAKLPYCFSYGLKKYLLESGLVSGPLK